MQTIRLAVPADAAALAKLRFDFRASIAEPVETEAGFIARATPWMADRVANGSDWRCWVLESAGAIVGNLWLRLIEKVPNPVPELETHAYITNVYLRPEARGGGGGERLLAEALAFCQHAGIDSAILWPTDRSRSLYVRHGFAVRDDLMEAIIGSGRHGATG